MYLIVKILNPLALAGVALWIECWPVNQRVAGSQSGHMLEFQARCPVDGGEGVRGNHTLMFLSLSFSLPSPLSKSE